MHFVFALPDKHIASMATEYFKGPTARVEYLFMFADIGRAVFELWIVKTDLLRR